MSLPEPRVRAPEFPAGREWVAEPQGVSVSGGRLFVADTNNHRIVSTPLDDGAIEAVALR